MDEQFWQRYVVSLLLVGAITYFFDCQICGLLLATLIVLPLISITKYFPMAVEHE